MKKLVLLLSAVPLVACATSQAPPQLKQGHLGVSTAQTKAPAGGPRFAIEVVDESFPQDASQGPVGDDRVQQANMPGWLWLKREGRIDSDALAEAHVSTTKDGKPVIEFNLTPNGQDQFAEMTRENIGHRLAIVVNGTVLTAPVVREPILGGRGQISGMFNTEAEANVLVAEMMGTK